MNNIGKLAPEGYPFILVSIAITALVAVLGRPLFAVPFFVLTLFLLYFFRDPERTVPQDQNIFVSPADGRVILIRDVHEPEHVDEDMKEVSIFMSPFDVHVNRSPCRGEVKRVKHSRGRFFAAYKDEASIRNEKIEMVLGTEFGDIVVRQVAGFVARRAVCRKNPGDLLGRGERYGIIKFSSRLDVYLPKHVNIKVKLNDHVKAGETIIAEISQA